MNTRTALRVSLVALLTAASALAADPLEAQDVRSPSPRVLNRGAIDQTVRVCTRQVPNLSRSSIDNARAILAQSGLALGDVRMEESPLAKGTILNQTVTPGTQVKCGTPVSVVVSSGQRMSATGTLPNRGDLRVQPRRTDDVVRGGTSDGPPVDQRGGDRFDQRRPDGVVRGGTSDGPPVDQRGGDRFDERVPNSRVTPRCEVPNLIDRNINQIQSSAGTLRATKLRWSIGRVERVPSEAGPGTILKQSPGPDGDMACGTAIDVWIAVPRESCTVPNLIERNINQVQSSAGTVRATKLQWSIGRVERVPSEAAPGTILKQSPGPGGTMACGTAIDVWIAVPRESCTVPNLVEQQIGQVQAPLQRWKLAIGRVERVESRAPEGTILKQLPAPGMYPKCGPTIDVWIAVPVPVQTCTVPNLIEQQIGQVQRPLQRFKLAIGRVERVESRAPEGTILKQSPAPGEYQRCDPAINVWIAVPPKTPIGCTVPDLFGQRIERVAATLNAAGLTGGSVLQRPSTEQPDTVIAQSLARGSVVTCGSRVDVAVAARQVVRCFMPDVRGTDIAQARQALAGANLQLGAVETGDFDKPRGMVVSQSVQAGLEVPCRSAVTLQVSLPAPPPVRVPPLQGQDPATARRTLEGVNLTLGTIDRRASEQTAGSVIDQLPAAGTDVQRGSTVQVWVSTGPAPLQVPDVRGRDRAAAAGILGASRFRLGEVAERPVDGTPGTIVEQQPAAGTLARPDTPVRVWVAVTPPIEVPPLVGRRDSEAAGILSNARLRVGTIQARESTEPRGTIIEQRPAARQQVKPNAAVDLVIARPIPVVVPDLRGRDRRGASVLLTNARLQLGESEERESDSPVGTVVDQSPRPGETVDLGSPVQVWTAVPVPIVVPSVLGRGQDEALGVLRTRRLRLGGIETRESASARGTVIEQRPPAGERVTADSTVDVVLAVPVKVVVPDLRSSSSEDSITLLRSRGLTLGAINERQGSDVPGRVVEQQPAAGTRVDAGTPVALWIAVAPAVQPIAPQGPQPLVVPDLRGKTREEAQAILVLRGLVLGQASTAPSNDRPDTVIAQQPAGASRVPPGTGVNVVLAVTPVQPRLVPNVTGMTQAQAGDALRAAGFAAGSTTNVPSPSPAGTVTAQMPVAGASAQAGAAIALELAIPVEASSDLPVPLPLVWTLLGGVLGVAAAATAAKLKGKGKSKGKEPSSPPSSVTLAPQPDPNMAVTLSADGPFTRSELMLRPFVDAGVQAIQGSGRFGMVEVTESR